MIPNISVGFVKYGILVATRKAVSVKKFIEAVDKTHGMRAYLDGAYIIVEGQDKNYVRGKVPVSDLKKAIKGTTLGHFSCYDPELVMRDTKIF
ncbi:hypothetical protein [Paenibacillus radicis (ex Xue et al. 2023)]|uniref:Uncharacterized protein n=1 Tax=Paenibacillus radicis (ex Xue et al. 2023) TaxID=2972489 RepID=A0ABT1YJT8_9BACL|nr:hypothetical protein [Paenibacillus radicis (ex Xue et al. 2023)]MCR8633454.1 hypothetical protein [Paenibacillus radicis (ex Xue et al. 2023)]